MKHKALSLWMRLTAWLVEVSGGHVRYGIVANNGRLERCGFATERHAKHWAWRAGLRNFEPYSYDTRQQATPATHYLRDR